MIDKPLHIRTAIVTGACSGMGLALTQHLLSKATEGGEVWQVVLADVNETAYEDIKTSLDSERHTFIRTDVSSWQDQVKLFKHAFEWSHGRIDFLANNAGISERQPLLSWLGKQDLSAEDDFDSFGSEEDLTAPDLTCINVDLLAVFYAMKLFVHCTRKTRGNLWKQDLLESTLTFRPSMVVTASMAGQYPFYIIPIYTAAKHGCVGLVRSAAPTLLEDENITLNCIMPGTVKTDIIPKPVLDQWPEECLTPLSTILRAFDELTDETGSVQRDGKSDGKDGHVKNGCCVECSVDQLFYREPVPYSDKSQEWVAAQSRKDGILGSFMQQMMAAA